jgi:hypothetical protein
MFSYILSAKEELLGLVRHFLTIFGGFWVATGYMSSDELGIVIGSVTSLVGISWSIYDKITRKTPKEVDTDSEEKL